MAWVLLVIAGLLEIVWATGMKLSAGFTRAGWTAVTIVTLIASMGLLALASRSLPIGTAYAVWVGIGAAGTAAAGMLVLGEPVTPARVASLALLILSLVALKLSTPSAP